MSDALHAEEVQRARVFFRIILAIAALTGAAIPWLTGVAWLRGLSMLLCSAAVLVCLAVLILLRRPERWTRSVSTPLGILFAAMGVSVIYYIGPFSAGAMILVVGIYFFGLSHHRITARLTYATVAVLYFLASAGIASGLLEDRSLFSTEAAHSFTRWLAMPVISERPSATAITAHAVMKVSVIVSMSTFVPLSGTPGPGALTVVLVSVCRTSQPIVCSSVWNCASPCSELLPTP